MGAGHDHGPAATQAARTPELRKRLAIAFALVLGIVLAQAVGAWVTGSLALLVDMVHSLTDSTGLLVALVAANLMTRPPDKKRTWGFARVEVVAALAQAGLLVGISVYALTEAVARWSTPPQVAAHELLVFGVIGLVLNAAAMLVLAGGRAANFNMKAAFLEVLMDALGTLAVIVSAVLMMTSGYARADTIAALFIALLIIPRAVLLIRDTLAVLMEFTPTGPGPGRGPRAPARRGARAGRARPARLHGRDGAAGAVRARRHRGRLLRGRPRPAHPGRPAALRRGALRGRPHDLPAGA